MIVKSFNICEDYASSQNLEYDFVKSINDILFKSVRDKIKSPDSLILRVGKLGNFFYKKTKVKFKLSNEKNDDELIEDYKTILNMYEEYLTDKLNFKYEKFGKQGHDAFILAKEQKKLSRAKEIKSK